MAEAFDIVFWPCVMDGKTSDVEAIEDGGIAVTLWNGAIRSSEHEHMAKLLRRKSRALVAFGSCAQEGCIPGLANDTTRDAIFAAAYLDSPSTANPQRVLPRTETDVPEGRLSLPAFYETVKTLDQTVPVDALPPRLPARGRADLGRAPGPHERRPRSRPGRSSAPRPTVCDDCKRTRSEKKIAAIKRTWQVIPDPETCLLEQGLAVRGDRDPRRLRRPLPRRQLALHRLLRPDGRGRGLRRPLTCRASPRSLDADDAGGGRPHHRGRHPGPGRHVLPLQPGPAACCARAARR